MRLPNGIFDSISFSLACGSGNVFIQFSYSGVQHSATTIAFTRMPYLSSSTAHSRVKALRAPLDAAYAEVFPCPVSAVLEVIFRIEPFVFFNSGNAQWAIR